MHGTFPLYPNHLGGPEHIVLTDTTNRRREKQPKREGNLNPRGNKKKQSGTRGNFHKTWRINYETCIV